MIDGGVAGGVGGRAEESVPLRETPRARIWIGMVGERVRWGAEGCRYGSAFVEPLVSGRRVIAGVFRLSGYEYLL